MFPTQKELDQFLYVRKEAKERDHRKLGKELDLFVISDSIGKGLPLLTPKGTIIRKEILNYEYELEVENGFQHVTCPHIASSEIYKRTGHWEHYKDVMYAPFGIDGEEYVLKPMNCPHHYMIFESRPRSYRELPYRVAEPGTCYRYEKSGELSGLMRVRALSIDDSHILMTEDQIESEFARCIKMVAKMFEAFGLKEYYVRLSLADPSDAVKYIADSKTWQKAGKLLEKIIKDNKLKYVKAQGEASFYGPKIDYMVKDSLGREWQMSTLQLDLFMGKRLKLVYTDKNGKEQHPVILHRGLTGSIERTLGILIEHYAGAFPVWLSPIQVKIIPISSNHAEYAQEIAQELQKNRLRSEIDSRDDTMQAKIRDAVTQKIPYMMILGDREVQNKKISLRLRNGEKMNDLEVEEFIQKIQKEISEKKNI
ncbi:MAG: Threonine-tRNA ligase [candidate division CPR3 bacterium GW2011_GWE2_35_7]|nr:MAG: Threonine-tRNA ligase [candidate division CPR3 bacterium GW2011_GWE2_35_7]